MWQLPKLNVEEIVIYLRKSRADDATLTVEEVLEKHEQMLDEWVERNLPEGSGRVPETNRYREVVSGETIASRPEIQEVLRRAESPRVKAVLIVEPQRLSRGDLEDIGRLVKLLRYSNTIVITMQYTYDLRNEHDRDAFERELKRGNEFLEYQKRIMNNGRLLAVQNGNYLGTYPPYGYNKIQIKEGKKKCYTLEPNPDQAPIVKLIFEMYAQGHSSHGIARHLNKMAVPSARGGKWCAESLKRLRTNEHYLGMVRWNHRINSLTVEDGELVLSRPINREYLLYPGKHEPIIDRDLWDAVQEIRGKLPPVKGRAKYANPFAGLVFCQCGRSMSRRTYKDKQGNEKNAPRLLCDHQTECGTPSCTVEEMTTEIIKVLEGAIDDFQIRIDNNASDSVALHHQLIERLEKRMIELDKLEISQWDKYTQEGMPKHIFDQLNAKVLAEKEEVQEALCTAKGSMPEPADYKQKKVMFSDALKALQDPDAPVKEKNLLLKQCIERIEYNRKKKPSNNRRWGEPEPLELVVHLRV